MTSTTVIADQAVGPPLWLLAEVTYACPLHCVFCYNPVDFAQAVADLLSDNGVFVFEAPYWLEMIKSGRFTDMVYHEHPTYFTIKMVKMKESE
jgi:pyrroloquinoline quinone biosynthesis protein E